MRKVSEYLRHFFQNQVNTKKIILCLSMECYLFIKSGLYSIVIVTRLFFTLLYTFAYIEIDHVFIAFNINSKKKYIIIYLYILK